MLKRLARCFAALLMWLVFSIGTIVTIFILPVIILLYAIFGSEKLESFIYRTGKGLDQICNAAWFYKGHPKETISSHCGRIILKYGDLSPIAAEVVYRVTNLFEKDHVIKAIEEPFKDFPTGLE